MPRDFVGSACGNRRVSTIWPAHPRLHALEETMHLDLQGRRAFVTGGSGAIGRAICVGLARSGVRQVAFTFFSNHDGADETARQLRELGAEPHIIRANLAHEEAAAEVIEGVRTALGFVDIFVSNAASGVLKPAVELREKHWRWTMTANAQSMLFLAKGFLEGETPMMGHGGRIIALSSLGAQRAIPQYTMVGASKAALEAVARGLAAELGVRGITVNVVSPGVVDTWSLQQFPNKDQLLQMATLRTPMGRITEPEDVSHLVNFLCSPQAQMITGQTLVVDGGYSALA